MLPLSLIKVFSLVKVLANQFVVSLSHIIILHIHNLPSLAPLPRLCVCVCVNVYVYVLCVCAHMRNSVEV